MSALASESIERTPFVTTQWSMVLDAQGSSPEAQRALEQVCRIYWRPIYCFLRREGKTTEDAQALTQSFFAQLLERGDFAAVRREKGKLRSYLLGSLKHFLANDRRRSMSLKRGEGRALISFQDLTGEEGAEFESHALTADRIFDRRWALTVLDRVFAQLVSEHKNGCRPEFAERLSELLADEADRPRQAEIAREFGMTENAVKQAFHRLRQRYRQLLREAIAGTVATPADIDDELRELIVALRA
jgi:RNA polymerase sigma-70 factor (ECF subfamily)